MADTKELIQVGYCRVDVTPDGPVPMTGAPADTRMSTENLTPLFVDALAFRDSRGTTVLAVTVDNTFAGKIVCADSRAILSEKLGIPVAAICISSTHTHSAPCAGIEWPYKDFLINSIVQCCLGAVEDLAPARMYGTIVKTKNMNFVRNYIMNDGSYGGTGWGDHSVGFKAHESEVDNDLQMVKFVREGRKDVLMTNFCAHPHREYNKPEYYNKISANMPYIFRKELEEKYGCHVAYFTGASGNVNLNSRIEEENVAKDYIQHGKMLAEYAISGMDTFKEIPGGIVSFSEEIKQFSINHTEDHKKEAARAVVDYYESSADAKDKGTAKEIKKAADEMAKELGFYNRLHAVAVLRKAQLPEYDEMPVQCFRVGELAFACMSGEPYDTLGRIVKDNSGYAMTYVLYISNVATGYLPARQSFENGGYGVYSCRFVPGTGEELAQEFVEQLQKLHEE